MIDPMTNPSSLLYDLTLSSEHTSDSDVIVRALCRSSGVSEVLAREVVSGPLRGSPFLRGATFIFAESVKSIVSAAGGRVDATVCPWSPLDS